MAEPQVRTARNKARKGHKWIPIVLIVLILLMALFAAGYWAYRNLPNVTCDHVWQPATCTAPATCSACGKTDEEALGHTWVDATCEAPQTCSVCGEVTGEPLAHTWTDAACELPETCSICGLTKGEPLGHSWSEPTCTTDQTCTVCGKVGEKANGHIWENGDCEEKPTCTVCGETGSDAPGHDWQDATCELPKTCSQCGKTEGNALGHSWEKDVSNAYDVCKGCGITRESTSYDFKNDKIFFGSYEQDANLENGSEPIEWIVLKEEPERVLLLSKYALDATAYNSYSGNISWENCSLRVWLNNTFLNQAFSKEEQVLIEDTMVTAEKNPNFGTDAGNDTVDKIFLLSVSEASTYLAKTSSRICYLTQYAKDQGAFASGDITYWWLRSPGYRAYDAAGVNGDGSIHITGSNVVDATNSIRPAIWMKKK